LIWLKEKLIAQCVQGVKFSMGISIIIAYKKYIKYLRECLQSLAKQTFCDYEIIIAYHEVAQKDIDKIKQEFSFDKIFFVDCGRSNLSMARNKGIAMAKEEYICFLDSDDYLLPNTLKTWMDYIQTNAMEIDIFFGAIQETSLKYENFLIDFYEYQTNFKMNNYLNIAIKNKATISGIQFNSKTVLGKLFRTNFLQDREYRFDEQLEAYAELPFILRALEDSPKVGGTKETIYVKRIHDDVINAPSLSQSLGNKDVTAIAKAYLVTDEMLNVNSKIKQSLDQYICDYFWNVVIEKLVAESSSKVQITALDAFQKVAIKISAEVLNELPIKKKRLLKKLKNKKYNAVMRYMQLIMQIVHLKIGLQSKFEFKKYLYNNWMIKLKPKKKTVVFESFLGRQYSCNPRAIYEYMCKNYPDYQLYWSIDLNYADSFENLKTIERFSLKWFWKIARAEYWIFNSRLPTWVLKPKRTKYLQTWHGTPLKKLVFDVEEVYMPGTTTEKYKQNFYTESRNWDYLISPNRYSSEIFKRSFRFEKKTLEQGYPRNDVLYRGNQPANIEKIKKILGIPLDKKVILYAPTFRDNQFYKSGKYKFELPIDLTKLQKRFSDNCVLLLRMHYLVAENFDLKPFKGFAYDFSNRTDINDLYLVSDLLITDYSSVFFDYANLQRPIAFYTYDLEDYRETLRGFYFDLVKNAPGPLIKNNTELTNILDEFIKQGKLENYQAIYEEFYQKYCYLDDGDATKRVVEKLLSR